MYFQFKGGNQILTIDNTTKIILVIVLFVFQPLSAWGTIGFAEKHSRLNYNQFATVHWIHPGDGCDYGKYCFYITKKDVYQNFKSLHCSLKKVNVPTDKKVPLIFAQCMDNKWLVYNLQNEQYLIQTNNYNEALNVWKANQLKEPQFADALSGAKGLYRTWESRIEDWAMMVLMFLPLFAIIALPLFTVFTLWFAIKLYRTRRMKYVLLFIFLLIPSLFLWILVIQFFGFSIMRFLN